MFPVYRTSIECSVQLEETPSKGTEVPLPGQDIWDGGVTRSSRGVRVADGWSQVGGSQ